MAQQIVTNQIANQVLANEDADALTEEERAAAATEAAGGDEAERLRQEEEARRAKPDRPVKNYEAELARRRDKEERMERDLKFEREEKEKLLRENERFKAKQELEREASERVADAQRKAQRPDPEVDPYGAKLYDIEEQNKQILGWKQQQDEERQRWTEQQRQQAEQQNAWKDVDSYLLEDVTSYKTEHPDFDYDSAAQFVQRAYMNFYKRAGLNDEEALAKTAYEIASIGLVAKNRKSSAAAAIADMAQEIGWKPQAKQPDNPGGNKTVRTADDKIRTIKKAQSLQGIGGKVPSERTAAESMASLSKEELANMSDDDYLRYKQDATLGPLLDRRLEELG